MALPFRYLFDFPANVFMNKVPLNEVLIGWVQILGWGILFWLIFAIIYKKGLKIYCKIIELISSRISDSSLTEAETVRLLVCL